MTRSRPRSLWPLAASFAVATLFVGANLPEPALAAGGQTPDTAPRPGCPFPASPAVDPARPEHPSNALPYRAFPANWQAALDRFTADNSIPGAVIIVRSPQWGVRVGTSGYANLTTKAKLAPDMQFRIGSVSKAFIAQTVLALEEQGRLRLSDPILKHLGSDPTVANIPNIEQVTIEDLLQMKTGLNDYNSNPAIGTTPYNNPPPVFTPSQLMAALGKDAQPFLPPHFAPNTTYPNPYWASVYGKPAPEPKPYPNWWYTNSNYIILGKLIERLTNRAAPEAIKQYVYDKIGLTDTYFAEDDKLLPAMRGYTHKDATQGKVISSDWCDVTSINPSYAWTAGAIVSTPWDILHFLEASYKTDKILSAATKDKWLTYVSANVHIGWEFMEYGVGGAMQSHRTYGDARGHGGAFPGYKTLMYYYPDSDTSFVLASNTWDNAASGDGYEVLMMDAIMPLVKGSAVNPQPANTTTTARVGSDGALNLAWHDGRTYGERYTVYLGASQNDVEAASPEKLGNVRMFNAATPSLHFPELKPNTTYWWRVDTVTTTTTVIGAPWTFHTAAN